MASSCVGLMAVVAVSSSVALVAIQAHKSLTTEFMEKVQLELGVGATEPKKKRKKRQQKKKVSFAADVVEPSSNNTEYRMRRRSSS